MAVAAPVIGALWGAHGFAIGLAIASWAAAAIWWRQFVRALAEDLPPADVVPDLAVDPVASAADRHPWKQLSGYWIACFRALAAEGVALHLVHRATHPDAPYSDDSLAAAFPGHWWDAETDENRIGREMAAFAPDALLVASWDVGAYRHVARSLEGRTLRILGMDNQWLGTPKQWGGTLISRMAILPCYDVAFVPGERQAQFARRLGFGDDRILWGFYTSDPRGVRGAGRGRGRGRRGPGPPAGVRVCGPPLVGKSRRRARRRLPPLPRPAPRPWPLVVCGRGHGGQPRRR